MCLTPTGPSSPLAVTPNLYKPVLFSHDLTSPSSAHAQTLANLPSPSMGALAGTIPPLSQAGLALESPQEGHLPAPGLHQGKYQRTKFGLMNVHECMQANSFSCDGSGSRFLGAPPAETPNGPPASTLIQSTSFLDSVPVTLTLEPRDLLGIEERGGGPPARGGAGEVGTPGMAANDARGQAKSVEVELRRRPGEGFGFVIASQEAASEG